MPRRVADFVVEPVPPGDLVAIATCHALYASTFPGGGPPDVSGSGPPTLWIARLDGAVVGFLGCDRCTTVLDVACIAVEEAHRGLGIGRALVRAAVASARERELQAVVLHVSTGNGPALELYFSEGFHAVRRLQCYYNPRRFPDGGDAFEMILRLR